MAQNDNDLEIGKYYFDYLDLELHHAQEMQQGLMPSTSQLIQLGDKFGMAISAEYRPRQSVGGDLFGVWQLNDDQIIVYVVDFSGHGIAPAFNTFLFHGIFRQPSQNSYNLKKVFEQLNTDLLSLLPIEQYATMTLGIIDRKENTFEYISSSAPNPVTFNQHSREVKFGDGSGFPLGISDLAKYETRQLSLESGQSLILYTDGLYSGPRHAKEDLDHLIKSLLLEMTEQYGDGFTAKNLVKESIRKNIVTSYDDTTVIICNLS